MDSLVEESKLNGREFSADDLEALVGPPDPNRDPNAKNNSIGSLFMAYSKAGKITVVGHKNSSTPTRKGGLIRVWKAA